MKINEQILVSLASDSSPPDKTGFLMKKGEVNKGFQRRYFVLRGNMLFYFEKKQDKVPVGVVILENCHVELCSSEGSMFAFQIVFNGSGARSYVLAADNNEDMVNWMKRITHAGYDYMHTLVEDLEKRLDKLKKAESKMVSDNNQNEEANLSSDCISDGGEELHVHVGKIIPPLPRTISRSKYRTLPPRRPDKKNKMSLADVENRWSVSVPRDCSALLETTSGTHDWVDFSERTDFLHNDSHDSARRFSINDFTPPSYAELKRHEKIEDETLFNLDTMQSDVQMHETNLPNSLANRIKANRRAKSERHRQTLPLHKAVMGGSFYIQRKPPNKVSSLAVEDSSDIDSHSNFQHLHRLWGAAIWVKVREYEVQREKVMENTL